MRHFSTLCWFGLATLGLFGIGLIASDYLSTVSSLQNFHWRVESLKLSEGAAPTGLLTIQIQNQSRVVMRVHELELYVQADGVDLGRTYGRFEMRAIQPGETLRESFNIELSADKLRFARDRTNGSPKLRVLGTYKLVSPFAEDDFFYRLNLPVE